MGAFFYLCKGMRTHHRRSLSVVRRERADGEGLFFGVSESLQKEKPQFSLNANE